SARPRRGRSATGQDGPARRAGGSVSGPGSWTFRVRVRLPWFLSRGTSARSCRRNNPACVIPHFFIFGQTFRPVPRTGNGGRGPLPEPIAKSARMGHGLRTRTTCTDEDGSEPRKGKWQASRANWGLPYVLSPF